MDVTLIRAFSHMIIMKRKVDSHKERRAGVFIKESSIKAIDTRQVLGKA